MRDTAVQRQSSLPAHPTDALVGTAPAMSALRAQIRHLAAFDTVGNPHVPTLLLQGATGTGKGLVAQVVHDSGPRAAGPFIDVNCAAIPDTLLEAELFGFEAGAFTDAKRAKSGLFEAASGGTLFLDEIDSFPLALQGKLLRAIEEKRVRRLGAVTDQHVDVKLIAATQTELSQHVSTGRFRADLYYRLAMVVLVLPSLHGREADIVVLAQYFLGRAATAHGLSPKQLSDAANLWLQRYSWPGNVRELSHLMERVTLLGAASVLDVQTLERLCLPQPVVRPAHTLTQDDTDAPDEATHLRQALMRTGGNVVRAARLLGLSRNSLRYRMRKYGMERPDLEVPEMPAVATPVAAPAHAEPVQDVGHSPLPLPTPSWEHKPVAVLAMEFTFPQMTGCAASRYEPWTLVARWEQRLVEKVQAFDGCFVQRAPALLTAVFGVPRALEQMPQRAVHAALAIQHLLTAARTTSEGEPCPDVRLAVHVGALLVDSRSRTPMARLLALGDTLALPVRLLGHASPGEVLVSSPVAHQVEDVCTLQARELPAYVARSVQGGAYVVVGRRAGFSAPGSLAGYVPQRCVGRERECATLHTLLAQAEDGQGQVVGLVGEPGIGKSRLLAEFRRSLTEKHIAYLEGRCLSYGHATPYLPVLDLLRQCCQVCDADSPAVMMTRVHVTLQEAKMEPEVWAPYLLRLLGLQEGAERLTRFSPQAIKIRTFTALRQLCLNSGRQPLVVAIEDLQWMDNTSEDWCTSLVESLGHAPVLFLVTYRPGYRPPWVEKSSMTQLALQPLSHTDSRGVVQGVCQGQSLDEPVLQDILTKAEGHPFFLEELTRAVLEHSHAHPDSVVPDTIQGVLMARIEQLSDTAKRLLQTAAVLGREVSLTLLEALWEGPGKPHTHLQELQRLGFLDEQVSAEEPVWLFKHVLTQEVAYESLQHTRRQVLHAAAGQALEALYADHLEEVLGLLAHHYSRSTEAAKAVAYLRRFAARATRQYAHVEAIAALQEACAQAERLPEADHEHLVVELALRQAFSLSVVGRFRDIRALLLSQQTRLERLSDPRLAGPYYFRLGMTSFFLGEYAQAIHNAQHALAAAQQCADTATLGQAYYLLALESYNSGRALMQGLAYGQQAVHYLEGTQEWHWRGLAHWVVGMTAGYMGDFPVALEAAERTRAIGEASGDPRLLSFAAWTTGWIQAMQGQGEASIAACQRSLEQAQDPPNTAIALGFLGYAYLAHGDASSAIPPLERAVEQFGCLRYGPSQGRWMAVLSEAWLAQGHVDKAQAIAQQALSISREAKHWHGIGLAQRAMGRIAQARGAYAEAEHSLRAALQTFSAMQARFEVGRTHLALTELAVLQEQQDVLLACRGAAHHT